MDKDEDFQKFIADPENKQYVYGDTATLLDRKLPRSNWIAMWIFLATIAAVAILGAVEQLRPVFAGKPLSMVLVIQMFMLLSGAIIIIATKTNPSSISKNEVFRSGMIAIVAVYGIAWMAETMFGAHLEEIKGTLGSLVKVYPWAYAIILLIVSKFVNSQAAALAAIVPLRWLSVWIRRISWPLRQPAMVTTFCQPTQAIWRLSSLTAPAPPKLAASLSTTALFCRA
nr:anaerobic C4-dicarboxylate transporter family protein [Pectobacterium colocasium]